jgi:uncharacterized protein
MEKTKTRIILDTNWYISASINRKSRRRLYKLLTDERFKILYSSELLEEYLTVISRPKFKKFISPVHYQRFIYLVVSKLEKVEISHQVNLSRDEKDNYLLAMAIDKNVDFLITGDNDLLILEKVKNTIICDAATFIEIFKL